jgi:hypothetical protein
MNRYATADIIAECYGRLSAEMVAEMMVIGEEDDFAALLKGELDDPENTIPGFEMINARASAITAFGLSIPPALRKVLPMCPVRSVTYVSGRSRENF